MAEWRELALGLGRGFQQGGALFAQLYPQAKVGQYNAAVDQQRYQGELVRQQQNRQDMIDERNYGRQRDSMLDQRYADELKRQQEGQLWNRLKAMGEAQESQRRFDLGQALDQQRQLFDYNERMAKLQPQPNTAGGTAPTGKVDQLNAGIENPAFGQFYNDYLAGRGRVGSWNPFSIPPFTQEAEVTPEARDSAFNYALRGLNRLRGQNAQMQGFGFGQPQKQTTDTTAFDPSKLSDEELMRIISGGQ